MDQNGRIDPADVKDLTRDQAEQIFIEHYFRRPRLHELPAALQPSVFDMYVNAGANAVKILQKLVTRMGFPAKSDGVVGPLTLSAVNAAAASAPDHIADAYGIARRNYYYALAESRRASRKYAVNRKGGKGGWIIRAEEFISSGYHLTEAQHKQRVEQWG